MARVFRTAILMACILSAGRAFAAGGACPSGANYINPANPIGALVTLSSIGVTSCYFASQQSGASDSNAGTSEASPWKNIPGMASCASTCASNTPTGGVGYILRGCDSWLNTTLPINWNWSGSSGNPIYIGMDKTWYNSSVCPSAWNRPIWNAQKEAIAGNNWFFNAAYNSQTSHVILDSIEMVELYSATDVGADYIILYNGTVDWVFSNLYLHAWNIVDDGEGSCRLIAGPTFMTMSGTTFTYNIIDGSDRTGENNVGGNTGTCNGFAGNMGGATLTQNVVHDLVNPFLWVNESGNGNAIISNNLVYNVVTSNGDNHCNAMEIEGGGTNYVFGNVIHDQNCPGGESMMFGGGSNETDYVWDNVLYNLSASAPPTFPAQPGYTGISLYYWNNTVVTGSANSCFTWSDNDATLTSLYIQNNHCITTASSVYTGGSGLTVGTLVDTPNLLQTPTQADTNSSPQFDQYTSSETYVYSPVASTNSTIGAGTNLTSSWPGGFSTNDTGYACTAQTVSTVLTVVCPTRTTNARPASGAWDVGAYEFLAGASTVGAIASGGVRLSGGVKIK